MARKSNGPWFREAKNGWYVWHGGKLVSLKVKGEGNQPEAVRAWHRLMAGLAVSEPKPEARSKPEPKADATVKAVTDAFLAAKKGTVKAPTHYVYACLIRHVTDAFGKLPAARLKPGDVLRWAYGLEVSASTRSDICGVLASAFRWAEGEGFITSNPLRGLKRPPGESRGARAVVTPEAHAKLMAVANPALRVLLTLLWETGARPSELARLTAQDVDLGNGVAVLTQHKTARHTGRPRFIALTPTAVAVLNAQAEARPVGPLLRNGKGLPWTKDGVSLAVRRASQKAGVKAISYGYRHGFATSALAQGVPDAQVAALLGHNSTAMLHRHYSHLTSQAQVLREALGKVRG